MLLNQQLLISYYKVKTHIIAAPLTHILILSIWKSFFVLPLFKGGDPTHPNNYQPISKLSVLAEVLETFFSNQMKDFPSVNNTLSSFQSGFS